MKWSEFKKIVDDKLDGEDPELSWIDIDRMDEGELENSITVTKHNEMHIM